MAISGMNAAAIRKALDAREISVNEVVDSFLARIDSVNPKINALLTVSADEARSAAESAQARIDSGNAAPLTGIPYILKDNICTKGVKTTCASKILEHYVPPYDSTVAQRLGGADAILLAKANMDEFAMGTSTEYSGFFPTKNPWNLECVPGGSSGGSAAAVAAQMAPLAFGSDTGGSIRQPASLCGVVGFKPTYGRISRYGLIAFGSSLDQIGPFSRTVGDTILAFEALIGRDPLDSTSVDRPYDSAVANVAELKGKRIAYPKELFSNAIAPDVLKLVREAMRLCESAGATVEEISLPMIEHGVSTYYIIAPAEASSNLARFDGVRYGLRVDGENPIEMLKATRSEGFGKEVRERIIIGTYVLSSGYYDAFYNKANQVRTAMKMEFSKAFENFDAIIAPTSPTVAFKLGEQLDDPMALKLADYCTIPANMGGFPAISLNAGFSNGLPVGVQLIADSFCEDKLFPIALGLEALLPMTPLAEI